MKILKYMSEGVLFIFYYAILLCIGVINLMIVANRLVSKDRSKPKAEPNNPQYKSYPNLIIQK
jgi:hypothetical protein